MSSNISSSIIASQVFISEKKWSTPSIGSAGGMQMAPNGKIYMSRLQDSLAVINNPNGAGLSCNFQWDAVALAPGSYCYWGLPDFIDANPRPRSIDLGNDTTFCKGSVQLNAAYPNSTYQWNTGETTSSILAARTGTYWVKVTDNDGCISSDTLIIKPELSLFDFIMPNIVTPNDDKTNDVVDFSKYQFSSLQIQIFNRWGQEVFKSESAEAIWKPTNDDGTYFYTGQYKIDCGTDSQTKNLKGFITVVR